MANESVKSKVLVTGGTSYIGSRVVLRLLEAGYTVHTTVRRLSHTRKLQPLVAMQEKYPGRLELFEANLLRPGAFEEPMRGCATVHHVASPFKLPEHIKDGQTEMLEPALDGVRNVLDAVTKTESVTRVILTSTIGAIAGDYADVLDKMKDGVMSEAYFQNSSSLTHNPYHYSKVESEKEAWRVFEQQGAVKRWTLVALCPGLVLGPSLVPYAESESGSLRLLHDMMKGELWFGAPKLNFCLVDVREVAEAHLQAMEKPETHGRYIIARHEMTSYLEIANVLRPIHRKPLLLPKYETPTVAVRLIGWAFGLTQYWIRRNMDIRFKVDNSRSIQELGISYRPVDEMITEHYRSWAEQQRK